MILRGPCYDESRGLRLDAYLPAGPVRAVVLYLHGGGFLKGSREEPLVQALAARLSPQAVAVVSADYRLRVPLSAFPPQQAKEIAAMQARSVAAGLTLAPRLCGPAMIAAVQDASAALAAVRGGLVPGLQGLPVVVLGVSAGGIAGLSLAHPPKGMALARPDAVLSVAGAMVQPWRLRRAGPPCVMLHGQRDRVIGLENPALAARRATAQGIDLRLVDSGVAGHNTQVTALLEGRDAQGRPYFDHLLHLALGPGATA
ncbi:hypothetical protein EGN72_01350 [Pseudorhodobacter sp. E13]|uniref:alpha/beta hydrolase n=1 Tax=Pseudorhodobacter sp. E13 TaxID=2487931 RepID=UPI000F8D7381|nr:hypothetical protein [Pseudorhodobacter sp. E13]RUS65117.1 hypothetical protein EGN72_01350 [Pseudorhodobacter sp. E13]